MTTQTAPTLQMIPLAAIEEHTRNVRRDLGDLAELADSLREIGLLEPIIVAPGSIGKGEGRCPDCGSTTATNGGDLLVEHDHASLEGQVGGEDVDVPPCPGGGQPAADAWRLIAGHRRTAAAAVAGLDQLPGIIRYDLKTEADQVMAMLVENLQRTDLTPIEEAEAYQQLELFGFKPAQIAKKTGRSKATVDRRLSLTKLSEEIQGKVQAHEITLGDAEALVEFNSDPKTTAELERYLGTPNWRWAIERARHDRDKAASAVRARAQLVKDGTTILEEEPDESKRLGTYWNELNIPAAEHAKTCEHHAALEPTSATIIYVCLKPETHPEPKESRPRETKAERTERLAREKAAAELDDAVKTAAAVRSGWLAEYLLGARTLTAEQRDRVLRESLMVSMGRGDEFYMDVPVEAWLALVGVMVEVPERDFDAANAARMEAAAANIERRDPIVLWLAAIAADAERTIANGWTWTPPNVVSYVVPWLRFLVDLGYELTDFEAEQLAAGDGTLAPVADPDEEQKARGVTAEALSAATIAGIPSQVALQPGIKTPKGRCAKCLGWAAVGSGDGVIGAHKGCSERGHFAMTLAEVAALGAEEAAV